MVLACASGADAVAHQPRERRQNGDGRVDAAALDLPVENDLSLGDVAGQVRNRVREISGRHRDDRQLRERARTAADAAGALEDRREVAVEVAGIALAARHFAGGRGGFPERLAVVGHVVDDHEHVVAQVEGQVLGGGQRASGSDQALGRRVIGRVEERDDARQSAAGSEVLLVAESDARGAAPGPRRR